MSSYLDGGCTQRQANAKKFFVFTQLKHFRDTVQLNGITGYQLVHPFWQVPDYSFIPNVVGANLIIWLLLAVGY
jgi:hypothetical protein